MGPAAKAVIDIDLEGQEAAAGLAKLSSSIDAFAANAEKAMYAVGAVIAVDKIRDVAVEMLSVFGETDKAARRLNATLDTTGNKTGFTKDQLAGMRQEIEDTSTTSAATMQEVQNIFARTRVIGGDIFKDAQRTSLDFAAAMDTDVKTAAEELAEALADPANEFERYRRFGVAFTDQEKLMLTQMQNTGRGMEAQRFALDKLNSVVGGQAAAAFDSLGGKQDQLGNKVESLKARFGGMIAEAIEPLYPLLLGLVDTFVAWMPVIEAVTESLIGGAQAILGWFEPLSMSQEMITGWAATVQSIFERWDDYIAVALLNAGAAVVAFATDIQYYFTDVIPTYGKSMFIIMKDIFFQLGDIISTVVTNIAKNIEDFWSALKQVMAGETPEFTPTSLLEGFELKLSELPELTEKKMSETEAVMRQAASDLSMELGADIAAKTQLKLQEAKDKEKKSEVPEASEPTASLNLGGQAPTSAGGTEGILAMADRISSAAAKDPVHTTNSLLAENNKLAAQALSKTEQQKIDVKVDVKQDAVVTAIDKSTAAIVKATEQTGRFG